MSKRVIILFLAALAVSCGGKKQQVRPAPETREFPLPRIPAMITEPAERAAWMSQHFWDSFTAPETLYRCDSLTVNGVSREDVERRIGEFATLIRWAPLAEGEKAMTRLYERLEAFQEAQPEGNVFGEVSALTEHYFFDPASPLRSEDLYLPFVSRMASSPLVPDAEKGRYAWDRDVCLLNRTGTKAADFVFIDTAGRRRTLYGIKAPYTLLIFGNPDCHACKELLEEMEASPEVSALIGSGTLKVVDIYIDEEIPLWKEKAEKYPKNWINGYDPYYKIRRDRIYAVRGIPSLYLLDSEKVVMLKDAPEEDVLAALGRL